MSIINEALKKATREKEAGFSPRDNELARRNIEIAFQRKKPRLNWGPIFILLVLALITGPIVAPLFSTPFKTAAYSTGSLSPQSAAQNVPARPATDLAKAVVNSEPSVARKAQFAVEESPLFGNSQTHALWRMPSLNLSGIVYSPEESYCIINNKIVKAGDTVQGAKLLSVLRNRVTLDYQGKAVSLEVSGE